jgi:hypothetical protein
MLALGYAILVIFLAAQLSIVGGGLGLAVSIATLVAAALMWPAWHRIQGGTVALSDHPRATASTSLLQDARS